MGRRKSTNAFDLAASLGQASFDTALTLSHRLPMLAAACAGERNTRHAPELKRMVVEKTAAVMEGAFAAQMELIKFTGAAMAGSLNLHEITHMPAAIAGAGLRSALRTVRANSRRLSRRG